MNGGAPKPHKSNPVGDLLDTNVWVSLMVPHHRHYPAAQDYWHERTGPVLAFCRQTQVGLMRLLGTASVMNGRPNTSEQSWAVYTTLLADKTVKLLPEPSTLDVELARLTQIASWPAPMWPDAYLAAFAIAANLRLVSFDHDFSRFPGLNWLQLTAEPSKESP